MKTYLDEVLTHGFAYGSTSNKLHGKKFIVSFTAGTAESKYKPDQVQKFEMPAFIPQFIALASICGLDYQGAVYSFGNYYQAGVSTAEDLARIQANNQDHAQRLIKLINVQ